MNKFFIMLFHTYKNKITAKSFIISTVISVLLVLFVTNLESIISMFQSDDDAKQEIAVIDETNELYPIFSKQLKAVDADSELDMKQTKKSEKKVSQQVKDEKLDGMFIIKRDKNGEISGTYKALTISDETAYNYLKQALTQTKTAVGTADLGVSQEKISSLYAPVSVDNVALQTGAKSEEELGQVMGLVYILLFMIYFAVIMYASMIAMEVATEKSSRVMEILISSMPPIQQMFAKLFGIALVGVTQLAIILSIGFASLKLGETGETTSSVSQFINVTDVPVSTIIYAVIFFLLGYFLYATMAAFLGSVVSRIEDVQQTITPMTLLVVAGFMIAMFGIRTPDAGFITATSFIPFFTPMIMFLRVGMLDIPFWQAALGIGITLLTIIILAVIGARIYKGGVLFYGNSSAFKAIKQALRLSKN
ncbi:ABC transporter permease [Bacillus atrophaeus]|uniref:ABC transporter permease n=1 Tax=Bacillus atrophaeus TaxID=1452 RepID=UPI0022802153|nr:ABC transporter permease [Bacillus atrophaeus]MCY8504734.1 ABC transporter permease [Bacillus atrophaeus]MCY8949790.1 ABC transporter permease [Bacillus atrophaeus]MCY8966491.1 ABC transporter permease [Bacillus atrophaeus]MCY9203825.1 ABC transporter permease [Bacillus atrophaeus]MEC0885480.1 ABC transporter permease [Bacillus atrophaeus]